MIASHTVTDGRIVNLFFGSCGISAIKTMAEMVQFIGRLLVRCRHSQAGQIHT